MKNGKFWTRFLSCSALLLLAIASHAQPQNQLKETVVTATRMAQPVGDVVADVTIIDADTITRAGAAGLADVLARVPGLEIARSGGVGNATSVYLRGGDSRHTAVLVDGVRLDAQNTSGGASWNNIPLSQIDRIEIVRGPTSAVYGSDAVAGVIQIFTKKGESGFSPSISLGYGSYNTKKIDFAARGGEGLMDYSVGVSAGQTDGFNIRPVSTQNPDTDGNFSNSASLRLGLQINPDHRVEVLSLESRMDAQYDTNLTKDDHVVSTDSTQSLQWNAQWSDRYASKVSVSQTVDKGQYSPLVSSNQTKIDNALLFNEYRWGKQSVSLTLEQRNDAFLVSDGQRIDKAKSQLGVGLGYAWTGDVNTVQLSARNDKDSEFGPKTTTSAAYALAFTPQLRALATSSTSFRVPTLYQRFHADYGVATLQPESGRSLELGLKYTQGTSQWGVAIYRNTVANLLGFIQTSNPLKVTCPKPTKGCYANTAEAQYQGITFSAHQPVGDFNTWASLDLQDPRDAVTGKLLKQRATHHATVGVDTQVRAWTLVADMQLSSLRYNDDNNTVVLPGYVLLNLSAQTKLSKDWSVLVRVDNATDATYQLVDGYATSGRALFISLKWAP